MTLKAAAAGLMLGGGKGVICVPPGVDATGPARIALLHDFADAVELLDGAYITAEDVGTDSRDMVTIAQLTRHVVGLPAADGGSGDPSPFTAAGVHAAIRACVRHRFGSPALAGRSVAIVGCGHVGERLARRLAAAGAQLLLADVDDAKRALADELPGARWIDAETALTAAVDVLAPCALGGVIDAETIDTLGCGIVCGAANNQLADDELAAALDARGILYAPDFIVNAGGLINVSLELGSYDARVAAARTGAIEDVFDELLAEASAAGITPLEAAIRRAEARLGRVVTLPGQSLAPAA
jgi:leucine dehydrogenase